MTDEYDYMRQNPDIKEYARKINKLQSELDELKRKMGSVDNSDLTNRLVDTRTTGSVPSVTASAISSTLLDEDDMASDSDSQGATQQSIKAYVDGQDHDHATPIATHSGNASAHHSKTVSSEIDHDATTNFVASEHVSLPNTTANVLSDMNAQEDFIPSAISTYVQKVSAADVLQAQTYGANEVRGNYLGAYLTSSGSKSLFFTLKPPEWLIRYASVNSLSIAVNEVIIYWVNTGTSSSYLDDVDLRDYEFDANTSTNFFSDGTNDTGTGLQSKTCTISPARVIDHGDHINAGLTSFNNTGGEIRWRGFQVTWELS